MELSCKELVELLTNYLEGALSPEDNTRFEAHLAECTGCRNYVDQMQQTIKVVGKLHEEAISDEAEKALLSAFRQWKQIED